jgi:hypothetical protein
MIIGIIQWESRIHKVRVIPVSGIRLLGFHLEMPVHVRHSMNGILETRQRRRHGTWTTVDETVQSDALNLTHLNIIS